MLIAVGAFAGDNSSSQADVAPYRFETFRFSDAPRQVIGVKYRPGDARSVFPLGGLGTGTVAIDSHGQFTHQAVANSYRPVGGVMAGTGFTIRAECDGRAVEKPFSEMARTYLGHFPIVDIEGGHEEMPVALRFRAMSPFIPGDARESATPAAMFRFRAENTGDKPVKATITFRWNTPRPHFGRKSKKASLYQWPEYKVVEERRARSEDGAVALAVTLESAGIREGCAIAALKGPGVRVFQPETTAEGASPDVITVAAEAELPPNGSAEFRFVLAWYYPQALDSFQKFVGHQYAHWFDGSASVAQHVAERWDDLAQRTGEWQEAIYDDPRLPGWLKDQLVNSLYIFARSSCWIKDGRFTMSESFTECPIMETIVCRFYGSIPLAMFFPELEKNTMRQFMRHQRADGAIPFAFGTPEKWDSPYHETQKILDSNEFILLAWRNYAWWRDKAWADEVYPAVKKAFAFAKTLDTDGDGLINDELSKQYYDQWQFYGAGAYTSGVWLAAIKAARAFAELQGDDAFLAECDAALEKALPAFEEKLWAGEYYRLWNDTPNKRRSDTCLAAQLTGQWFAFSAGLGEVLPKDRIVAALEFVRKTNGSGDVWALVNGVTHDGSRDKSDQKHGHSHTATLGETWCYAATCIYAGRPNLGMPLAERLAKNISLRQRRPWNTTWNLNPDTGEMLWGAEYYSNPCVWDLWGALTGQRKLHQD